METEPAIGANSFYSDPVDEWCQGDIFANVPHVQVHPPIVALRERLGRTSYDFYDPTDTGSRERTPPGGFRFNRPPGDLVPADALLAFAVMLTHDCDLDNDPKNRVIALVRKLDSGIPETDKANIRRNGNANYFYLPEYGDVLPESYVDFRRISSLPRGYASNLRRVASLRPSEKEQLQLQLFFFFTRLRVRTAMLAQLTEPNERR